MAELYPSSSQELQMFLTSTTFFWVISIALVIFIVVSLLVGFKRVAKPGTLKWLILHSLSIFLIGYFLKDYSMNRYLYVLIIAIFVTMLSSFYRYLMYKARPKPKNLGIWGGINLLTLLVVQIFYEVIGVTEPLLQILFAGFCLTFVGTLIHKEFKD